MSLKNINFMVNSSRKDLHAKDEKIKRERIFLSNSSGRIKVRREVVIHKNRDRR